MVDLLFATVVGRMSHELNLVSVSSLVRSVSGLTTFESTKRVLLRKGNRTAKRFDFDREQPRRIGRSLRPTRLSIELGKNDDIDSSRRYFGTGAKTQRIPKASSFASGDSLNLLVEVSPVGPSFQLPLRETLGFAVFASLPIQAEPSVGAPE